MNHMSTQARELAAAAYAAGEMDFRIAASAAELAAAHAAEPAGVLRAGKGVAAATYAEADENHDEELIDEWEELVSYYEDFLPDDGEPDPDLGLAPWADYSREQILTAAYLLVTRQAAAEPEPSPYVGSEATRLLGSLGEHLRRELGDLGNRDSLDMLDELEAAADA